MGKIWPELGLQPREISKGTQTTLPWAEGPHSGRNRTWAWPTRLGGLSSSWSLSRKQTQG